MRWDERFSRRFWLQVEPSDYCWTWGGRRSRKGYGLVVIGSDDHFAHRIAWRLANSRSVPEGMFVLHRCDNRPCVRPSHLFLGTLADNNADMKAKGRTYRPTWVGSAVPTAKVTEADVAEIRRLYRAGGVTQTALAIRYGLNQGTVNGLIRGRTWRHVA